MFDLIIQQARICDGTGNPSFMGTLGVTDRRITYLGRETGLAARRTINADGLVLAPGFIDPHTHYDAQIAWDPLLTSSPWHGVTTVVMGNCGVGVAPVKPETRDLLVHDLVNVEAIPYDVMEAGIDWQWESYGEYLESVDRRGLGINVAGLVALTPVRHYVMGEASFERHATPEEMAIMRTLLREAMQAGAFGFSTTTSRNHTGSGARPLACRNASREELASVCHALRDVGRGAIEIALNSAGKTIQELAALRGQRPVDAYLDLAIADDLQTRFQTALFNYDEAGVERLIRDERFLIGLSDGGAHVDVLCDAGYATALLDIWVRQREVLSLEQAVHKLTAVPATLFGIPDRGRLAEGSVADLVLFDPQTVAANPPEYVRDFPRQGRRLISKAEGIVATFVSGTQVYTQGTHTGAFPGRVLRSHE